MRYLLAILALGLLIALHELGHLLLARLFRVKVRRYALGFGPVVVAFQRGDTEYSLRAIPVGGYVQIHGMNPHEDGLAPGDPTSYASLAPWKRALVLAGGPLANYVLAVAVLCALYIAGTHVPVPMTIGAVEPASEAARAQLRPGDVVLMVDGVHPESWTAFAERVAESPGQPLTLDILRHGDVVSVQVRPRRDEHGAGRIGVQQQYVYKQHAPGEALASALVHTERLAVEGLALTWRLVRGRPGAELSGPIAVVKQTSDAASSGPDSFLRVLVALSIALAVFNLLPFPALDGGRILFVAIEAIAGRAVPAALETLLHAIGFLLLLALMGWVAWNDARQLMPDRPPEPPAEIEGGAPLPAVARARPDAGMAPDAGRPLATAPLARPDAGSPPDGGHLPAAAPLARPDAGSSPDGGHLPAAAPLAHPDAGPLAHPDAGMAATPPARLK